MPLSVAVKPTLEQLQSLFTQDRTSFKNCVDFSLISLRELALLAPICFLSGKATPWEDPPTDYSLSYKRLRQWGRLSKQEKQATRLRCDDYINSIDAGEDTTPFAGLFQAKLGHLSTGL